MIKDRTGKLIYRFIAIFLCMAMCIGCSSNGTGNSGKVTHSLYFDINFESNWFFDKYNVELYVDDTEVDVLEHGEYYTKLVDLEEGKHTVTFYKEEDHEITTSEEINLKNDMTFQCTLKTGDEIELNDLTLLDSVEGSAIELEDMTGSLVSNAKDTLEEAGFINVEAKGSKDRSIWDDNNWIVSKMNVEAGKKIDKNTEIVLTCVKRDEFFKENIKGKSITELEKMVKKSDYSFTYKDYLTEKSIKDKVSEMSDSDKEKWIVKTGEFSSEKNKTVTVNLVYSGNVKMINVKDINLNTALKNLKNKKFSNIKCVDEEGNKITSDYVDYVVLKQSVSKGTSIAANKKITLTCGSQADYTDAHTLTVRANSGTFTYDGTVHEISGFVNEKDGTITVQNSEEETYYITGLTSYASGKDVSDSISSIEVEGTAVIKDKDGNDVTNKFTLNIQGGSLKITKATVKLKSQSLTKASDGSPLTNGDNALEIQEGWASGEGATYTFTSSQTEVGSCNNEFTVTCNENTKRDNYEISVDFGTLTVTEAVQSNANDTVYITKTGDYYHANGCKHLAKSKIPLTLSKAVNDGYMRCSDCPAPELHE